MATKWRVKYGIINNQDSITSRDQGSIERDSKDECLRWIEEERKWLRKIGYKFWYVYDPVEIEIVQ